MPTYLKSTHYWMAWGIYIVGAYLWKAGSLTEQQLLTLFTTVSTTYGLSRVTHKLGRGAEKAGVKTSEFQHTATNIIFSASLALTQKVPVTWALGALLLSYVVYTLGRGVTTKQQGMSKMFVLMR